MMKRLLSLMLAAAFIASLAPLVPARGKSAAADPEFASLLDRYYAAWNTLDPEKAAPFYAKDADLIFYDIAPMKYNGWSEYKAGVMKAFFNNIASGKLSPNADLKVTRRGTIAWTTLTFHLSTKMKDGTALELDARHTAIWERRDGKWLIVHEHVSTPLPG